MPAARPLRVRSLRPDDLTECRKPFFDVIQLLIAHGDHEHVASLHDSTMHRVRWIIERDGVSPSERPATFFDAIRFLIAHGDFGYVESLHDSAIHRMRWIVERDADTAASRRVAR